MKASSGLKLSHKGFILIGVPLFFEIIFFAVLLLLLNQAEHQAAEAERKKEIEAQATVLISSYVDAVNLLAEYGFTKSKSAGDRYDHRILEITAGTRSLLNALRDEPDRLLKGERLVFSGDRIIEMFDRVKTAVDEGEQDKLSGMSGGLFEQRKKVSALTEDLQKFVVEEKKARKAMLHPEDQRKLVKEFIAGGVVVSVLIAVALALFFNKGTARRLRILMDNTAKLAHQQSLNPLLGGGDELAHLDSVFHEMADDLTELSRKERALVDYAEDVICSIDASGTFLKVNPACLKVWGYTSERLIGKPVLTLVARDDAEQTREWLEGIKSGVSSRSFENRIWHKDRSVVHTLWSAHWSETDSAFFCVAHDLTARKELELRKQELVAMVSHDLRSPLGAILNFFLLLSTGAYGTLSEKGDRLSKAAERSCKRLIALINDLLDLERLEAGEMPMEFGMVSLSDVMERSVDAIGRTAEAQEVILETDGTAFQAYADGDRLVQVVVNLVGNAIKYSPKGGKVTISAHEAADYTELRVTDQGRGIPAHMVDSVFERFKQVEVEDATKKGGTGLGLAICKAIIDAHHGTIGVDSEEGKGSAFWFRIPKQQVSAAI